MTHRETIRRLIGYGLSSLRDRCRVIDDEGCFLIEVAVALGIAAVLAIGLTISFGPTLVRSMLAGL